MWNVTSHDTNPQNHYESVESAVMHTAEELSFTLVIVCENEDDDDFEPQMPVEKAFLISSGLLHKKLNVRFFQIKYKWGVFLKNVF